MTLKVYPAIDILAGNVVRLRKGRVEKTKVYSNDPVGVAQSYSREGANGLHVVDLDGTLARGNNLDIIQRIVQSVDAPVQVGGGIRTETIARRLIKADVDAVVVGTVAIEDEATFDQILRITGPSRMIVALDYIRDQVLVKGWNQLSNVKLYEALHYLMKKDVRDFLLTCADRDGTMEGPDVNTIRLVCKRYENARIFASGGVRSTRDVEVLKDAGAYAVIVGKALLEGAFNVPDAIKAAGG